MDDWNYALSVSLEASRIDVRQIELLGGCQLPLQPEGAFWTAKQRRNRSTSTTTWTTPADFLAAVLAGLGIEQFDLDPASPNPPSVPCRRWFTEVDNGLIQQWLALYLWLNPPYERLAPWVKKAIAEYKSGRAKRILMLIPNRPGTVYWRKIVESGAAIFAIDGRLHFGGAPHPAPFACALVAWGLDEPALSKLASHLPPHFRMKFH